MPADVRAGGPDRKNRERIGPARPDKAACRRQHADTFLFPKRPAAVKTCPPDGKIRQPIGRRKFRPSRPATPSGECFAEPGHCIPRLSRRLAHFARFIRAIDTSHPRHQARQPPLVTLPGAPPWGCCRAPTPGLPRRAPHAGPPTPGPSTPGPPHAGPLHAGPSPRRAPRARARACPFRPVCPGGATGRAMITEIPPAITCFISTKSEILVDHAAACAGAAYQPAHGSHGHHAPLDRASGMNW
jgi:hypothetical protein